MTVTVTFKSTHTIKFSGVAADTKPTPDERFSSAWFVQTDGGGKVFLWDGDTWYQLNA